MVELGDLKQGERFLLDNKLYIYTDHTPAFNIGSHAYAVGFYSGELILMDKNLNVEKVN